ncbi:hypothetical protein [Spirillospora sp. NPDC047279]|uniref:hypothetical protein n=1 Tax=Spirillospora sp. NPDC047279 TaxID=3155478 RepID=UPI0033FA979A
MQIILRLLVAAGLAVDAIVHWRFAPDMKSVGSDGIDGQLLFQAQAIAAAVAGVLVLVIANRVTYAIAFLVAASAVGALVLYYYVDVGDLGPIPNMHEPVWYGEKTLSALGEGIASVAALIGFFTVKRGSRRGDSAGSAHSASV